MPMIAGRDDHRVDIFVVKHSTKIRPSLGVLRKGPCRLANSKLIRIAQACNLDSTHFIKLGHVLASSSTARDKSKPDFIVSQHVASRGRQYRKARGCCRRGNELSSIPFF